MAGLGAGVECAVSGAYGDRIDVGLGQRDAPPVRAGVVAQDRCLSARAYEDATTVRGHALGVDAVHNGLHPP
jgi:hypothetical protein